MPVIYDFLPPHNLLYFAGAGLCSGEEYVEANQSAAADPRRRPGQSTILDLRAVSQLSVSPGEMQRIVKMDRELKAAGIYGTYRTALLVRATGRVEELLVRLYNALVAGEDMKVDLFHDLAEALSWLGAADALSEVEALFDRVRAQLRKTAG